MGTTTQTARGRKAVVFNWSALNRIDSQRGSEEERLRPDFETLFHALRQAGYDYFLAPDGDATDAMIAAGFTRSQILTEKNNDLACAEVQAKGYTSIVYIGDCFANVIRPARMGIPVILFEGVRLNAALREKMRGYLNEQGIRVKDAIFGYDIRREADSGYSIQAALGFSELVDDIAAALTQDNIMLPRLGTPRGSLARPAVEIIVGPFSSLDDAQTFLNFSHEALTPTFGIWADRFASYRDDGFTLGPIAVDIETLNDSNTDCMIRFKGTALEHEPYFHRAIGEVRGRLQELSNGNVPVIPIASITRDSQFLRVQSADNFSDTLLDF